MKRFGFLLLALALLVASACNRAKSKTGKDKGKDKEEPDKTVTFVMDTSMGPIEVELNESKAPITVKNFLAYVDDKFYDGTIFHRVIPEFMIQGGGFTPGLKEKKTKDPIKNESGNGLSNLRGNIAMARTEDPDSATAQFYILVADKPHLDEGHYCVFGTVTKGMDVVDKIADVETGVATREVEVNGRKIKVPMKDVPVKDVVIKSIRRKTDAKKAEPKKKEDK